jgi:hypothetical protein
MVWYHTNLIKVSASPCKLTRKKNKDRKTYLNFFKAVQKELYQSAKLKSCPSLHLWIRSVGNALWWSFEHCQGKISTFVGIIHTVTWYQQNRINLAATVISYMVIFPLENHYTFNVRITVDNHSSLKDKPF